MRIPLAGAVLDVPGRLLHQADNPRILAKAGLIAPVGPDKLARMALAGARWSPSPAALLAVGTARHGERHDARR